MKRTAVSAVDESLVRWHVHGAEATRAPWGAVIQQLGREDLESAGIDEAVVVPASDEIELFANASCDWGQVLSGVHELVGSGWKVTVMTELARLGTAHLQLRGSDARLQGWWVQGDRWRFSDTEIA